VLLAAVAAGLTAGLAVRLLVPPRRPLRVRLRPYAALSRTRLGAGPADPSLLEVVTPAAGSGVGEVFGPMLGRFARALSAMVDAADTDTLERRLRQAGWEAMTPDEYRMRQLGLAVAGTAAGVALGLVVFRSAVLTGILAVGFGLPAATSLRNRVERAVEARCDRLRAEAYTVCHLLAVLVRTGHGPVDATRTVVASGRGPVVEDLGDALGWIGGGLNAQRAWDQLAERSPEPGAARLYRLLAASARTGGDLAGPLRAIADDLRAERRERLARAAVRRRTAMLLPLLALIAPVMVLFIGAALPALVLGIRS
jgi:Flp pilus assembly protein TadB